MSAITEQVRWGALGCARVLERRMLPGFSAAGDSARLVAVASRDGGKAAEFAERHRIARSHGSYKALLNDPDIEAVYIPLPNDQHREWTLRCLAAGKHVLCDKPMALSYRDAVAMADAAQAAGLRLMEAFMCRHHPQHERVAEIVRSGEIGNVAHFGGTFTYLSDGNRSNIRWNAAQGGGAFLDVGVYPLNAARFQFDAEPVAASAVSITDASSGVDIHTAALLEWDDGRTATILGGFDQTFTSRYEIRGPKGVISLERAFQAGDLGVTISVRSGDDVRTESLPHIDQYGREIAHFSACVRDASLSLAPGENGVAQARVVEAIARAAREKRRVEITEVEA